MKSLFIIFALAFLSSLSSQTSLEGYVFEENNRGFLNEVYITVMDQDDNSICQSVSNMQGQFTCETLLSVGKYILKAQKDIFYTLEKEFEIFGNEENHKKYINLELKREDGYLFDATLAESRDNSDNEVDAIQGSLIEIYNNTKQKPELVLKDHPHPAFQYTLKQGNHYTIMVRKDGYFAKRVEAHVNIDGCILCVDGVSELGPGISDNLTAGHAMGTLLANIELEPAVFDKTIKLENIYYDYDKYRIKTQAKLELDKLVKILKDNPKLIVELGSHTDSRGKAPYNLKLSENRAKAAVQYIIDEGNIDSSRIAAKGYGETQLVNNCTDSVNCSEAKHQENRRTEFKIIGYQETDNEFVPLEDIVREESYNKILEDLQQQQIYQAPQSTPEDILHHSSQAEGSEARHNVPKTPEPNVAAHNGLTNLLNEEGPSINSEIDYPPSLGKLQNEEVQEIILQDVVEKNQVIQNTAEETIEIALDPKVELKSYVVPEEYTGYKVEIMNSKNELDYTHDIFLQHGKVYLDVVGESEFSYLLGNYLLYDEANIFMNEILLPRYPNAKIIYYDQGVRNIQ